MNEDARHQSTTSKAMGYALGFGGAVALTGAGLYAGKSILKGVGRGIGDDIGAVKSAYSNYRNKGLLERTGEILQNSPVSESDFGNKTFVRTARGGANGPNLKVINGETIYQNMK